MLLLIASAENLTRYNDNVCQFALCTFNLCDQPTKRERVLKNNKIWEAFIYICILYIYDENQNMLIQLKHLYLHILFTLAFQLLILK